MEVLIVVDVQNCFMFHNKGNDESKGATGLNVQEEQTSTDIIKELDSLVEGKTHVVFSRDFHPVNHISLQGYEGRIANFVDVWPKHCRNKTLQCKLRVKGKTVTDETVTDETVTDETAVNNNFVDTETGEVILHGTNKWKEIKQQRDTNTLDKNQYLEVVGTELSYMFFTNDKFREPVRKLVISNRNGRNKIGLMDTTSEAITGSPMIIDKNDDERTIHYGEPIDVDGRKYISLTKGERCDKEAYSAFNYHITYDSSNPASPKKSDIPPISDANSSGLWEWILKTAKEGQLTQITVTVCGLVGNVCVMHSLLQGIALWNNVYSKLPENKDVKVKFVYSLKGTRFAAVDPFKVVNPDFITDNVVGHFNQNLPEGMKTISLSEPVELKPNTGEITSFEVLGYDGTKIKIGTFDGQGVNTTPTTDADADADADSAASGGMHRRSIRRRKNKSRKSQKRQKGRRTHKNKRRYTKRR